MNEAKIKETVYSVFNENGELLPEDQRTNITEKSYFVPENVLTAKVSLGYDSPMIIYKYGGNAKASYHGTATYVVAEGEHDKAVKYLETQAKAHLAKELDNYKEFLDASNIDWEKVSKKVD